MKTLLFLFAWVGVLAVNAAEIDLNKTIASLALGDGRILTNVSIVSYAPTALMAKWDGGRGTISYELFPADYTSALSKRRPNAAPVNAAPVKTPALDPAKDHIISGQVFITTRGAGAYKFPAALVMVYAAEDIEKVRSRVNAVLKGRDPGEDYSFAARIEWSKALRQSHIDPLQQVLTDADGRYTLKVTAPQTAVFIFCETSRTAGRNLEHNFWLVPIDKEVLDLNDFNQLFPPLPK